MASPTLLNIGHSKINPGTVLSVLPLSATRKAELDQFYRTHASSPGAGRNYTCELRSDDGKTVPVSDRSVQEIVDDLRKQHGQQLVQLASGEAITGDRSLIERLTPSSTGSGTLVHFHSTDAERPTTFSTFNADERSIAAAVPGLVLLDVGFARVRPRAPIVSIVPLSPERQAQVRASTKAPERNYTHELRDAANRPSYASDKTTSDLIRSLAQDFGMSLTELPAPAGRDSEAIDLTRIHDVKPYTGDVQGLATQVRFKADPSATRQPFTLFAATPEQIMGEQPVAATPNGADARSNAASRTRRSTAPSHTAN